MTIDNADSQNFGEDAVADALIDYMDKNKINTSGFHIQCGAQFKLLVLNMFVNARYTIADDVIAGKSGFPSVWTGLAFGF